MTDYSELMGWVDAPKEVEEAMMSLPIPIFSYSYDKIKDTGKGKISNNRAAVYKVIGNYNPELQEGPDCVAVSSGSAVTSLSCIEIFIKKDLELFEGKVCSEDIYGGSRVNIGNSVLGHGGGSFGVYAARYVSEIGTIVRKKYDFADLTKYNWPMAYKWGLPKVGVPNDVIEIARSHRVKTVSKVSTYEEVRDALYNGYPVTIASQAGFHNVRDAEGFAKQNKTWPHQMYLIDVDDNYKRPGVLCVNSWGRWNSGPKRFGNEPDGSFWIDAEILQNRILKSGDCWVYSDYDGFPIKEIEIDWF